MMPFLLFLGSILKHSIMNRLMIKTQRHILMLIIGLLLSTQALAINSIQIQVGKVDAPAGSLKNATFQVDLNTTKPTLKLNAALKPANEQSYSSFSLNCGQFKTEKIGYIDCLDGLFRSPNITAPFTVHFESKPGDFSTNITFHDAQFSDESGLHAGEGLTGYIKLNAKIYQLRDNTDIWSWNGVVSWTEGELFWQPFYFGKAGNKFSFNGTFTQPILSVENATLEVNEVGTVKASGQMNTDTQIVENVKVDAKDVDFVGLYDIFLKPMAEKSAFGNMTVSGRADWQFEMKNLSPTSFNLDLRNANIRDNNGKFDLQNLNAHLPWDYDETEKLELRYDSGHLLNMPLGKTKLNAEVNRFSLTTPLLTLPILDGALNLYDISAARIDANWVWHLRLDVSPITMNEFSKALDWPTMNGKIAGEVPLVTYANKQLNIDGKMRFTAFNGSITMENLKIDDPLGVVPRLYADLALRDLDMGEVTRTFSFGAIEGKLDGDVKKLVLENWKPVSMDASIQTADGSHLKKISQRAVENITALGGEGTAAALQRTFLRFFDSFNYEKIGLSCKLRRDICEMGGVESTPAGYIIVKGSGMPSVNVNGFTARVSLTDLLDRMKRITDSNTKVRVE
jgi:hypothetical protein